LRSDPTRGPDSGNNTILSSFYFRFSENWAVRLLHRFEARDGTLEEQYYTLYRDFRSWTAGLTFRVRDNRIGPTDYGVAVTFSLKAIPRFKLGDAPEQTDAFARRLASSTPVSRGTGVWWPPASRTRPPSTCRNRSR